MNENISFFFDRGINKLFKLEFLQSLLDKWYDGTFTDTENTVLKNIVSMCPNKTCIVSTHRPSILKLSSKVYRVKDKKLIIDSSKY